MTSPSAPMPQEFLFDPLCMLMLFSKIRELPLGLLGCVGLLYLPVTLVRTRFPAGHFDLALTP